MPLGQQPWTPVPDPTLLTGVAVTAAKDEMRRELVSVREVLEARLDASDKAIVLLQTTLDRLPEQMNERVAHLHEVVQQRFATQDEHFRSIAGQFIERDIRSEQTSIAAKEAIATALQAAKEAVGAALQAAKEAVAAQNTASNNAILKSETSTDKRIDETIRLLNSTTGALDARIALIAESSKNTMNRQEVEQLWRGVMDKLDGPTGLAMRLESVVARGSGREDQGRSNTATNQWMIGALLGGAALLLTLYSIMMKLH